MNNAGASGLALTIEQHLVEQLITQSFRDRASELLKGLSLRLDVSVAALNVVAGLPCPLYSILRPIGILFWE